MHRLLEEAESKLSQKSLEHNSFMVSFRDYCPFGDKSAATFVHREALRVCVQAEQANKEGMREHLIDMVVFGMLMWDLLEECKEFTLKCPHFLVGFKCFKCKVTGISIRTMWRSMCEGTGALTAKDCRTYQRWSEGKK